MADLSKDSEEGTKRRPPATTPDGREKQMIALAFDRAEAQLLDGTASTPLINHFLKLGSSRERIEQAKIKADTEVAIAKIQMMAEQERTQELYDNAIEAMRTYQIPSDEQFDD